MELQESITLSILHFSKNKDVFIAEILLIYNCTLRFDVFLFIYLSTGAVECESSCFATTLLHHAPSKVTSLLVLFVIFGVNVN